MPNGYNLCPYCTYPWVRLVAKLQNWANLLDWKIISDPNYEKIAASKHLLLWLNRVIFITMLMCFLRHLMLIFVFPNSNNVAQEYPSNLAKNIRMVPPDESVDIKKQLTWTPPPEANPPPDFNDGRNVPPTGDAVRPLLPIWALFQPTELIWTET